MEKTAIASLIFVIFLCAAHVPVLAEGQRTAGEVKYISGTSVYIDVGEADGLAPGDTVSVVRGGSVLGRLIVTATAAHSSSCAPEGSLGDIKVGDRIIRAGSERLPEEELPRIPAREKTAGTSMAANLMHGRVAIGSLISEDLTSSGLDFSQPSMNARLKVENLGGMPLTLDLRQRLRYLGQGRQVAPDLEENRWANRVYELALVYEEDESPLTLRFGRFSPSFAPGLGYVDGALAKLKVKEHFSLGLTGGTRPDYFDSGYRLNEKLLGMYTGYQRKSGSGRILTLSAAFAGSYGGGTVDREYFCFSGRYARGRRFGSHGSLEVDLNRGWKDSAGRPLFEITSLYLSSDFRPFDKVSVRLSFDNRKNPRSLFNRSIPDSLFDDSLRRGLHTGASWNLSDRIHVDGSFGIRFREGMNNTLSAQGGVQVRDLLREKLILDARFSLFTTTLSTGYRPAVAVRLPPFGSFDVDVSMGSYIYDFGSRTSTIPWIDSTISYRANRSISLSTSLMSYLSGESRSVRVFSEMGFLF